MKIYKFLAILTVAFFVSISANAQRNYSKEAEKLFNNEQWIDAIEAYKKASGKVSNKAAKAECIYKVGECYRKVNDMKNAETWFAKAIKAKYPDPTATLYLAEAKNLKKGTTMLLLILMSTQKWFLPTLVVLMVLNHVN